MTPARVTVTSAASAPANVAAGTVGTERAISPFVGNDKTAGKTAGAARVGGRNPRADGAAGLRQPDSRKDDTPRPRRLTAYRGRGIRSTS